MHFRDDDPAGTVRMHLPALSDSPRPQILSIHIHELRPSSPVTNKSVSLDPTSRQHRHTFKLAPLTSVARSRGLFPAGRGKGCRSNLSPPESSNVGQHSNPSEELVAPQSAYTWRLFRHIWREAVARSPSENSPRSTQRAIA